MKRPIEVDPPGVRTLFLGSGGFVCRPRRDAASRGVCPAGDQARRSGLTIGGSRNELGVVPPKSVTESVTRRARVPASFGSGRPGSMRILSPVRTAGDWA